METTLDTLHPAGVLFVGNVAKMAAFYEAIARMKVIHTDSEHVVLETAGFQLTIHALPDADGGWSDVSHPTREDSYVKLCFPVADLAFARSTAASLGGELWSPDIEWQARGFRACDGRDPEGNVFQPRQN